MKQLPQTIIRSLIAALLLCLSLTLPPAQAEEGPYLVKDINNDSRAAQPKNLIELNGLLYFTVDDGTHGRELWRSDGTVAGTTLVKDIRPGAESSGISEFYEFYKLNNRLYFVADDGANGRELWQSDGTLEGTVIVKDINPGPDGSSPGGFIIFNNTLYFGADDGTNGDELWKSDGTSEGTVIVKDINSGPNNSSPSHFFVSGNNLYFSARDGIVGRVLWRSDGTESGTIKLPHGSSDMENRTDVNGTLFFSNSDGDLWKSDGTPGGTVRVKDFELSGIDYSVYIWDFTNVNGTLFFVAEEFFTGGGGIIAENDAPLSASQTGDLSKGAELWKSDGTDNGTVLVKDINPSGDSNPDNLTAFNDTLYFAAYDGANNGRELWQSDGTENGTTLVKDINPNGDSSPANLTVFNNMLYFAADDGTNGTELWQSDGTENGTILVKDINPSGDSDPGGFITLVNGTLFFVADDGVHGQELWAIAGSRRVYLPLMVK